MKKLNLRWKLTLLSIITLTIACIALTISVNFSAGRLVSSLEVSKIVPAEEMVEGAIPMTPLNASEPHKTFRVESIWMMILVVLAGSAATYLITGLALKPIHGLAEEIKKKNIDNLGEKLALPAVKDELYELSFSFNRMSDNLQRAFLLQKQFSADVAHELRTPIAVMRLKLDIFKLSKDCSADVLQMTKVMGMQLDRLSKLIEDLLWFSKDNPIEKKIEISLLTLVSDMIEELFDLADTKQITIRLEGSDRIIYGEDALLERVFYNIIENAIKYSPEHTEVVIQINEKTVLICDNGEGISDENKEMIFEPFFRIDKSRNRKIGGNGLGLPICKKILDRHAANISVRNNHPRGSIFEISFPS